jgi:hypothetical protein
MEKLINKKNILTLWLNWHFLDMPQEIVKNWKNFLVFSLHFFSVINSIKTFFSHWHKYRWSYGRGFSFSRYAEVFFSNMVSRLIGAFLRSFFIVFGFISTIVVFLLGLLLLMVWIFLPLLLILGVIAGISLIFNA